MPSSTELDAQICHVTDEPSSTWYSEIYPCEDGDAHQPGVPPEMELLTRIAVSSAIVVHRRVSTNASGTREEAERVAVATHETSSVATISKGAELVGTQEEWENVARGEGSANNADEFSSSNARAVAQNPFIDDSDSLSVYEPSWDTDIIADAVDASQALVSSHPSVPYNPPMHSPGRHLPQPTAESTTSAPQPTPNGALSHDDLRSSTVGYGAASSTQRTPPANRVVRRSTSQPPEGSKLQTTPTYASSVGCDVLPPVSLASGNTPNARCNGTQTLPHSATHTKPLPAPEADSPFFHPSPTGAVAAPHAVAVKPPATLMHVSGRAALKDLVSHVDVNSFGFEIRELFYRTNFRQAFREIQSGLPKSSAQEDCARLFRILAKNNKKIKVGDMHELLVLFTPCGVSPHEGADFLREECGGRTSLTFRDFVRYGPALCERIGDFEQFERLSDAQKLIVVHARVLPGRPPADVVEAWQHLQRLASLQASGKLPRHARPLRAYEDKFLVFYHDKLVDEALMTEPETAPRVPTGDPPHEHVRPPSDFHLPALPHLRGPELQKEHMDWRGASSEQMQTSSDVANGSSSGNADGAVAAAEHGGELLDEDAECSYPVEHERDSEVAGRHHHSSKARGSGMDVSLPPAAGASRRDRTRLGDRTTSQPLPPWQPPRLKNMGRPVEEEYWERRTLDDHLITQLQSMYRGQ